MREFSEESWREVWAKAPAPEPGERRLWLPLHTHLTDTGELARLIWDEWLGPQPKRVVVADCGGADAAAREIVALAAGLHDLGKCTPAFTGQVPEMKLHMEEHGFRWPGRAGDRDSRDLPHALAGHVLVDEYLRGLGVPALNAKAFAVIVGGHHGVPPNAPQLSAAENATRFLGKREWSEARGRLVEHVVTELDLQDAVESLREVTLSDASQLLITAVVIMADWLASNERFLPLAMTWGEPMDPSHARAAEGWRDLGLPNPWRASEESLHADASALLRSRFKVAFEANSVQEQVLETARAMTEPGLLLIEAPMGIGKTEASLLAAEVFAANFGCTGVFYGLPTRATADAMFERVLSWWRNVPGLEPVTDRGIALRHGMSALNDRYRALPRRGRSPLPADADGGAAPLARGNYVDIGRDESVLAWNRKGVSVDAVAHHWTSGRKQASFADTVIATIDHELLAALCSRHVVLRHLGLARQVVVLDEVHAADTWMQSYMNRALEWLGRYGVPVIAMSATLPPAQRQEMVGAYERGRRAATNPRGAPRLSRSQPSEATPTVPDSDDYPLITALSSGAVSQRTVPVRRSQTVHVDWLDDDLDALVDAARPVVDGGGCVLVVRNTVSRAVATYHRLREMWGEGVSLAHSRFVAKDRLEKDEWLRENFGPDEGDRDGRLVVATQVAEQSLDIDFDLLVTDLAPMDLVLQRIGRLHRHDGRFRPAAAENARCLVAGLPEGIVPEGAPVLEPGGTAVYGAHLLLRSAALIADLVAQGGVLRLPVDIPTLVRRCYSDQVLGPVSWQPTMAAGAAEFGKEIGALASGASVYLLRRPGDARTAVDLLRLNAGEAETDAGAGKQVRAGDGGFEVIVVEGAEDGLRLLPQFQDDRVIPSSDRPDPETARLLARSMVRVPGWVTSNEGWMNSVLDDLAGNWYPGWQKDPLLSGQLVLLLDTHGQGRIGPFDVTYNTEVGMEVSRG